MSRTTSAMGSLGDDAITCADAVTMLPLERFREGVELYRRGDVLKVAFTP